MFCKKIFVLVLCLLTVLSAAACQKESNEDDGKIKETTQASTTQTTSQNVSVSDYETTADVNVNEIETELSENPQEETDVVTEKNDISTTAPQISKTAQIVEMYKKAAAKSNSTAKSEQVISLVDISVNNGEYKNVFKIVGPIISKLLANNSTQSTGITGGFKNLVESDVAQAKTYKVGNNTAIEMTMREQNDGARTDANSGPVGHAISAVGDISVVTAQLNDLGLPIELSEEDTTIHYTNPTVKVIIGNDGKIICGTWSYRVEIRMNNYKVGGTTVETTSVILDNVITVNGGFSK